MRKNRRNYRFTCQGYDTDLPRAAMSHNKYVIARYVSVCLSIYFKMSVIKLLCALLPIINKNNHFKPVNIHADNLSVNYTRCQFVHQTSMLSLQYCDLRLELFCF